MLRSLKALFLLLVAVMFSYGMISLSPINAVSAATLKPVPIKFGQDKCKRCLMKIKSPKFSAEVGNPETGKVYKFDDIGCAVMWLYYDCKFPWASKAKIWVTDAKTGKWLDAKKACWVDGMITPMRFGLGAFKKGEVNKKCLTWEEAKKLLLKRGIKKENHMKKFMPKKWEMKAKQMCILK